MSIVLGLLASNYIAVLNNYKTISCIVVFFSAIMIYNAYIRGKEAKIKKDALKKLDEEEALLKIKYANTVVDVSETSTENNSENHSENNNNNNSQEK